VQDAVPGEEIFLAQFVAFILLAAQFLRVIFGNKCPHLVAESEVFGSEFHIHVNSPQLRQCSAHVLAKRADSRQIRLEFGLPDVYVNVN
jgi:hypothetical protein